MINPATDRVLITGAAGAIGSALRTGLHDRWRKLRLTDVRPVTNLRFTQSFLDALGPGAVRGISAERAIVLAGWDSIYLVPSLHLASWNFTGGAKG